MGIPHRYQRGEQHEKKISEKIDEDYLVNRLRQDLSPGVVSPFETG